MSAGCFRKFLKNTGGFRSFWAFLWLRFEIQVSAIRVDYFEPRKRFWRNSFSHQSTPQTVLRYGTKTLTDGLWSEIFRVVTSQTKNGFFLGSGILAGVPSSEGYRPNHF